MIKISYNDISEITLPAYVLSSLVDSAELAHIRVIDNCTYVIITYPNNDGNLVPVCIQIKGGETTAYYQESLDFESINEATSFSDFIIYILNRFESLLVSISNQLDKFESNVENGLTKEDISNYFSMNKRLIFYETAINAIKEVVRFIAEGSYEEIHADEWYADYTNIKIEINQLNANIDMYQKVIDSIMDVSDSLFSNKLNITMKRLTSITLVLSVPTFITSFYGMNINLPFQDHPYSLQIVFVFSLVITSFAVAYLYRKDYF